MKQNEAHENKNLTWFPLNRQLMLNTVKSKELDCLVKIGQAKSKQILFQFVSNTEKTCENDLNWPKIMIIQYDSTLFADIQLLNRYSLNY